ncbi:MAG: CvpA family protein [Bacilli bacterium]|nr:CvpA family protein [Bacilli bacterium]
MNIVDYLIIVILLLCALKGFKNGLIPSAVNLIGTFLVFIIAFYFKQPISTFLYENLPFLSFGGIFKGVIAVNILFYEAISYLFTIIVLWIIFGVIKKISVGIQKILNLTILLNLPSKIVGGIIGLLEGILFCFLLLFIGSVVNTTAKYVNESKYSGIILNNIPIINNVTSNLINSGKEIYNITLNNKNDVNKSNLESIDTLMKYEILTYESAIKLQNDNKLKIEGIETVIEKYKEKNND